MKDIISPERGKILKRKKYTSEFKTKIVLAVLSEKMSVTQASKKYKIKPQVISRWKTEFLEKAPQVFSIKNNAQTDSEEKIEELERMVGKLTMQLEILKKASQMLN